MSTLYFFDNPAFYREWSDESPITFEQFKRYVVVGRPVYDRTGRADTRPFVQGTRTRLPDARTVPSGSEACPPFVGRRISGVHLWLISKLRESGPRKIGTNLGGP